MSEEKGVALSVHATQTPITGEEFAPPVTAESQIGVMRMSDTSKTPCSWDGAQAVGSLTCKSDQQRMPDKGNFGGVVVPERTFANEGMGKWRGAETSTSLRAAGGDIGGGLENVATTSRNQVRRLTPLECTRLQGFPDGWVDIGDWEDTKGRLHKEADAPKYKALGNSIAIPFWEWMARRMVDVLKRDGVEHPTMCSLFDGIGGFPLSFKRAGCEPVWASEIEEFPIAVTKRRFPEPSKHVSRLPSAGHGEEVKTASKAPLRARGGVLALNDQGGR